MQTILDGLQSASLKVCQVCPCCANRATLLSLTLKKLTEAVLGADLSRNIAKIAKEASARFVLNPQG